MADYVDPEPIQATLFGEQMPVTDYTRNLERIVEMRDKIPTSHKAPVTLQDQLREINSHEWNPERTKRWLEDPEQQAASFLRSIGVDLASEHHRDTPRRLANAMRELTAREEFKFTTFEAKSQNMITLGPIPFYTLCAHHVLPFHGHAWVGYVPEQRIAGLSKFARAVEYVAKGFHVQEELTTEIHQFLSERLEPKGLAVVLKAQHMCMEMRGAKVPDVITTTSEVSGVFADHDRTAKLEFLEWIRD